MNIGCPWWQRDFNKGNRVATAGLGVLYEPEFIVADAIRRGELERVTLDASTADLGGIHLVRSPDRAPSEGQGHDRLSCRRIQSTAAMDTLVKCRRSHPWQRGCCAGGLNDGLYGTGAGSNS